MKIYNKTTTVRNYGFPVPASEHEGERGPGVLIDIEKRIAMTKVSKQIVADQNNGDIEIAE